MQELRIPTAHGEMAVIDYGGDGPGVLMAHDMMENASTWNAVGERVAAFAHPYAVDQFAHGQTRGVVRSRAGVIAAFGEVADQLGLDRPLLVGQGVGGWVATSATVMAAVRARGLLLLEGAFPGSPAQLTTYVAQLTEQQMLDQMADRFRLGGAATTHEELETLVADLVAAAERDWVLQGQDLDVLRASIRRSFRRHRHGWVRHPTLPELRAAVALPPDPTPLPCAERYASITCPMTLIFTWSGVYAEYPREAEALVQDHAERRLSVVHGVRNISATDPNLVVHAIAEML